MQREYCILVAVCNLRSWKFLVSCGRTPFHQVTDCLKERCVSVRTCNNCQFQNPEVWTCNFTNFVSRLLQQRLLITVQIKQGASLSIMAHFFQYINASRSLFLHEPLTRWTIAFLRAIFGFAGDCNLLKRRESSRNRKWSKFESITRLINSDRYLTPKTLHVWAADRKNENVARRFYLRRSDFLVLL